MAWNFFKKDKDESDLENNSLNLKLDAALKNVQEDKRIAQSDVGKIESWAAEVIVETFAGVFPNGHLTYYREKYKKDALANYEKYKAENSEKVEAEKLAKCDKLVKGYMNQIELRKSKLKLYEKIEAEYLKTKEKLKEAETKKVSNDKLDKHEERLKELDSETGTFSDAMSDTAKLEEINNEINLKTEYLNQVTLLADKYSTDDQDSYDNALAYKEEIDKMLKELD